MLIKKVFYKDEDQPEVLYYLIHIIENVQLLQMMVEEQKL